MLRPRKGMMSGPSMVLPPSDLVQNPIVASIPPKTPTKRAPVKQAPIKRAPVKPAPTKAGAPKGMMTGGVKGGPTKQAPIKQAPIKQAPILNPLITPPRPTGTPIPEITNLPRPEDDDAGNATIDQGFDPNDPLNQGVSLAEEPASAPEPETEMTFTFFKGAEEGKGNPNYLFEQRGRNDKATVEDLEEYFNAKKSNRLRESFGDFDNYLAYMTEREQLIQSGDYDVGNWAEADAGFTEDQQMIFEGDADLTIDASDPGQNLQNLRKKQMGAQSGAYENWVNSEANQALLEKYGVSDTVYSETGDKFRWNGSAYVKTQDEDKVSMGDYAKMAMGVAVGAYAGPALGNALTGGTTAATGTAAAGTAAGTTAATTTAGSFVQGAVNKAIGSAISQGIATGSVDAGQLAVAGITGGIGGVADAIKAGELADTAAANAIESIAKTTGLSVADTTSIVEGAVNGVVSGDDIEDVALGAVQGYTSAQIKNVLNDTFGDDVDVPNVFDEGTTTIPIESLDPFVDTAVNAVFEGQLEATDVLRSIIDYSQEGGSFAFLDPGIDLPAGSFDVDLDLFGDTPQFIKEIEDTARFVGRETEDIVRAGGQAIAPIVEPPAQAIGDVLAEAEDIARAGGRAVDEAVIQPVYQEVVRPLDEAVVQPTREVIKDVEDVIKEAVPQGTTPNFPSVQTPQFASVDLPSVDLPSVDLPSLGSPQFAGGGGMFDPLQYNLGYTPVELQQLITSPYLAQPALKDYEQALVGLETRNLGMLS